MSEKHKIVGKMIENSQKMILEDEVKIDYYQFIATIETNEQAKAQWLVEADKTKVSKKGIEDALDKLIQFSNHIESLY